VTSAPTSVNNRQMLLAGESVRENEQEGAAALGLSRRSLLMAGAATAGALAIVAASTRSANAKLVDIGLAKRTIIGYAWPWTVRPGASVEFKVSTFAPGDYSAELVRLICADAITDDGKHYKEESLPAPFATTYKGKTQTSVTGSFVEISDPSPLNMAASFTVAVSIMPTLVKRGTEFGHAEFSPSSIGQSGTKPRTQHIVSRWDDVKKAGWSLALDDHDRVTFLCGDGSGTVSRVSLSQPVSWRRWVRISAAYDASAGRVRLTQEIVADSPGDEVWRGSEFSDGAAPHVIQKGALRFGAASGAEGNEVIPVRPADAFNGKIDCLRIAQGAIRDEDVRKLHRADTPSDFSGKVFGWWDFAQGTGTINVHDISGNGLDGKTSNLPERAVVGIRWDGTQLDWRTAPRHYSAMYFHDSAMIDAGWQTDFRYQIPAGLKSGIYAAKLRHGASEDYIPFYVAPPKKARKAKLALLLPTFTYLAYANVAGVSYYTRKKEIGVGKFIEEEWMPIYSEDKTAVEFEFSHFFDIGMGLYRYHSDGALNRHASMRFPSITDRPKAFRKGLTADTDIIEWLEHENIPYDLITDDLLEKEGLDLLSGYKVVMTGNHTEYLTLKMRNAYLDYTRQGGRLMSMGGNSFHNRISMHSQIPGVIECRKKEGGTTSAHDHYIEAFSEFDGLPAGKFRELGLAANKLIGLGMTDLEAMTKGTYYRLLPAARDPRAAFITAGVTGDIVGNFGKVGGGAVSEEIEHSDYLEGTPGHALVIARSENIVWPLVSEDGLTAPEYRNNFNPKAEIIFFETPNGGAVFAVGSMGWRGSLYSNGFNNNVAQISMNVLRRFMDPKPFVLPR
jgi:N,N-dimethylformamidase